MERGSSASDVGAKNFQNRCTQCKTAGDKVETRKFLTSKTATMVSSKKMTNKRKICVKQKSLKESGQFLFSVLGGQKNWK